MNNFVSSKPENAMSCPAVDPHHNSSKVPIPSQNPGRFGRIIRFRGRAPIFIKYFVATLTSAFISLLPAQAVPATLTNAPEAMNIFVRPGGTSYTWIIGNGTTALPGYPGSYPVTTIKFYDVTGFNWLLTRGRFQYSTNAGVNWTDYNYNNNFNDYTAVPGKLWRFVDTTPGNTITGNSFGVSWTLQGVPSSTSTGGNVIPDNPPTDITIDRTNLFDNLPVGRTLATLTPVDTGSTKHGFWAIENQSVPNLFTITFDPATGNTATLKLGTGTLPTAGQTTTVTVRYYDLYQIDSAGVPLAGQGFSKTFTFTVVPESTSDLNFGNDLPVNTYTANDQSHAATATLSNGNFVVVWQSAGQAGKSLTPSVNHGIYGQLFSSLGVQVGGEFVISSAGSAVDEITPAVTPLNDGRFAVAYATKAGSSYDIAFRIIEANGAVGPQQIVNTIKTDNQYTPVMTTLSDGSFVIVWNTESADIKLRQFGAGNGAAIGSEITIVDAEGYYPGVAALSNGSYAIVWVDSNTYNVKLRIGANGSVVDTGVPWSGYGGAPRIAALASGFVVATESYDSETESSVIKAALYDNNGVIQGSDFLAHTRSSGNRYNASLATLSGGGFVIAWDSDTDDYELGGIFGRRYTAAGVAVDGVEFEINQHRSDHQSASAIAALGNNLFATVWTDIPSESIDDSSFVGDVEARVLLPSNVAPSFVGATTTLTINQNSGANDCRSLLHVSDTDSGQTLTWSQSSAPANGSLSFSDATASSGSTDITPEGAIFYTPNADFIGSDSFTVQVSDGMATATRTILVTVVDNTPPAVSSITRASGSPTAAVSVDYIVTFNETVSGVDASDFVLFTSGTAAGSVASVSSTNGSIYVVTIDNISGNGTLRLDLKSSGTEIQDAAGNTAEGGFSAGQVYTILPLPVISSSLAASGTYGDSFSYAITAENSPIGFGASGLPGNLTVDPVTGIISGISTQSGTFPVILTVTNGSGFVSSTLMLTIEKAPAIVTLNRSVQLHDGLAKSVVATTVPDGLQVSLTFNGSSTQPADIGTYTVVAHVTDANHVGGATNLLYIADHPEILTVAPFAADAGYIGFTWSALPGVTYQVQYATDLFPLVWTNLNGSVTATNLTMMTREAVSLSEPKRFYRVQLLLQ